jgi:hypothetical protein
MVLLPVMTEFHGYQPVLVGLRQLLQAPRLLTAVEDSEVKVRERQLFVESVLIKAGVNICCAKTRVVSPLAHPYKQRHRGEQPISVAAVSFHDQSGGERLSQTHHFYDVRHAFKKSLE